jgi:hypothetical protein
MHARFPTIESDTEEYLLRRGEAGTPKGKAYVARLEAI